MSTIFERIRQWFRGTAGTAKEEEEPVATPPAGADAEAMGDTERETSTNAQTEGAVGEPWPGDT